MPPLSLKSKIGKSTLSAFLRTDCDRELYFSLYKSNKQVDLISQGMPAPLVARPNIQLITKSGVEFEDQEMDGLVAAMGTSVIFTSTAKKKYSELDLLATLPGISAPAYCLQPEVEPEGFRVDLLNDFKLTPTEASLVPSLSGMRPDVIVVRPRAGRVWEVLPGGQRSALTANDTRMGLSVVDMKNTAEGNRSYAAEVVLYSIVLARWLRIHNLEDKFFVSDECFLWTHSENGVLSGVIPTTPSLEKLQILIASMELVYFSVIAPSVIKFFKEDIPRVVNKGNSQGWNAIEYHVGPRCSNCDWLGYQGWVSKQDEAIFNANSTWYCQPAAKHCNHLSMLPNLSKGARTVLEDKGVADLTAVGGLLSTAPELRTHSLLKKECTNIPHKAVAILTNTASVDATAALAGMADYADFHISIAVNFDSAAGLLTGLACRGVLFLPADPITGAYQGPKFFSDYAVAVADQSHTGEWNALYAFLAKLDSIFQEANQELNGKWPKTQLLFWEHRQFEELCASVGRHLPQVLAPTKGSLIPALAWLFPPPELIETDAAVAPYIVFLGDLAKRVLRIPQAHASTLHGVHEHYHHASYPPSTYRDIYFIDPMGNGIPRERIFEVWKNPGIIHRGSVPVPKGHAIAAYEKALKDQCRAIASIGAQMRIDFKGNLKGDAPRIDPSVFRGATKVAFDSKLWIQWTKVEHTTSSLEHKAEMTLPAEALEANYKAFVFANLRSTKTPTLNEYDLSPESAEAKLDETGAYFTIGKVAEPGFPLESPKSLGLPKNPLYAHTYTLPLYKLIRARIVTLDRRAHKAEIEFLSYHTLVFNDLLNAGLLPTAGHFFLMEGAPYDDTEDTENILKAVGNPKCAVADPSAIRAMGAGLAKTFVPKVGNDPITPLASVLWEANRLATMVVRNQAQAAKLAARAKILAGRLDSSQEAAIKAAAENRLTLIWGPPGTGKTSTLTAYLLALIDEAVGAGRPMKILLTGPNYRAVEVLMEKLLEGLNRHTHLTATVLMVYSRSRAVVPLRTQAQPHVTSSSRSLGDNNDKTDIAAALSDNSVAIFGTSAHSALKMVDDGILPRTFDLIVIDESSQVPVTLALRPLATLKDTGELVIAGDPMQMPPIQALQPPVGAEHLVGSIHKYITTRFPAIVQRELLVNYRSGANLVAFARTLAYPPGLVPHIPDRRIQLLQDPKLVALPTGQPNSPAWAEVLDPAKTVCTILHDDPQSSQANLKEAKMVAALVYLLSQTMAQELAPSPTATSFTPTEFIQRGIGIVTPHKAQRSLIVDELGILFPSVPHAEILASVDTVERFQGGERYCIIVSFGVGDVDVIQGEEEFLLQMERANVAISRAMGKCIVIMPKSLAYHLPDDSRVAKTAIALKSYVQEFCSNRQKFPLGVDPVGVELRWK